MLNDVNDTLLMMLRVIPLTSLRVDTVISLALRVDVVIPESRHSRYYNTAYDMKECVCVEGGEGGEGGPCVCVSDG